MIVKKILKYVIALVFTFWPVTADIIMNELDNMNISINTTITIIVDLIWPILLIIGISMITSDLKKQWKIIAGVISILFPIITMNIVEFARFGFHGNSGPGITDLEFLIIGTILVIYGIILILRGYKEIRNKK